MTRHRLLVGAAIGGLALTSMIAAPGPASAAAAADHTAPDHTGPVARVTAQPKNSLSVVFAPPCKSKANSYIVCFSITQEGVSSFFRVHVGIDVTMSRQDAQNIIDAPGEEFSSTLYGEDTFFDDTLKNIPVTWSAAWEGGLSAEFDTTVTAELLDEDSTDPTDEIFARVKLRIPSTGGTRSFRTNNINEPFHLYR